jgi:predicted dinucleotide-binding enzyme
MLRTAGNEYAACDTFKQRHACSRHRANEGALMKVAIIGSGHVGQALAQGLRRGGHGVTFGARTPDPAHPDEAGIAEAVAGADATILATPFAAASDVIAAAGGFAGCVLIDATNPLSVTEHGLGLTIGHTNSGAETIAAMAPSAHVFKTFNQTGFENMADAPADAARPVMFVAGDDVASKAKVLALVESTGFEAVDAGPLHAARLLEPLAML